MNRDYEPLSQSGGHGTLGYRFEKGSPSVTVPPVPELEIDDLPDGVEIVRHNLGQTKRGYRAPLRRIRPIQHLRSHRLRGGF